MPHLPHRWLAVVSAVVALVPALPANPTSGSRPNVVLVITDDAGYGDFGCYGATDIRTPHIDRLAHEGVRLTDFYATPQCSPTRAALLSGRYQQRVRIESAFGSSGRSLELGLPANGRTLPQLLKNHGYATGLVGKWHLGYKPEFSPQAHGFDYAFGPLSGYIDFYHHVRGDGQIDLLENGQPVTTEGYATDLFTARATRFIEQHAAQPFFLAVTYTAPHWPFQPPGKPSRAKNNGAFQKASDDPPATRADYAAMLECADAGFGQILATIDRLGLTQNTLVIFTNDNGGEWLSRNAPFFHRKGTVWEGGIRVPAVFRWPGHLPAGRVVSQPGITMDLTATILAATGATVPDETKLDGIDLLPILAGRAPDQERTLFWRFGGPNNRLQRAVRQGDWKLLVDAGGFSPQFLFHLRDDPGERNDLAATRPEIVARLLPLLDAWEKEVEADALALLGPPPTATPPAPR
jgi:arylsulfatase A-like enzyme